MTRGSGVAGSSYGGGLALMLAGADKRVDAVGADIAWNSLTHALFPNASGDAPAYSRSCGPATCSSPGRR